MRDVEVVEWNETTTDIWKTLLIAVTYTYLVRQAGSFPVSYSFPLMKRIKNLVLLSFY